MNLFVSPIDNYALHSQNITTLDNLALEKRSLEEDPFIVSNVPTDHAYILAKEVNLYARACATPTEEAMQILYQARELRFEYLEENKQIHISSSLFVIGEGKMAQDFCLFANQNGFDAVLLSPQQVLSVSGSLGAFELSFNQGQTRRYAQGVLFVALPELLRYKGIESAGDFDNQESLLHALKERLGDFYYHDILHFDATYCQYQDRREKCCCACAEACPTFGIYNDDSNKTLHFSSIDCITCGKCLAVCPTGAIEFQEIPKELIFNIAKLYRNHKILLLDEKGLEELEQMDLKYPDSLLPLVVPEINALNPLFLLNFIQESGHSMALYKSELSDVVADSVDIVNLLMQQGYQKQGIFVVQTPQDLQDSLKSLEHIEGASYYYTPRSRDHYRTIFAERIRYIVKDRDLGQIPSYPHFRYGEIHLKEGCTLCLSCVEACNVGALSANEQNFTLNFSPSLCTTCEYCLLSCPEHVILLERNGIALNSQWFETRTIAKGEPFKCVECGAPFATLQSVQKIRNILAPKFAHDERKLRTLECCPDCKVRVMAGGMV